jgi:stage V sporulation protein G
MEITEVRISLRDDQKLKAFVSITLDDKFVIRGLKVIQGAKGLFVAMPSRKRKDGEYQDIAHPINNETRQWMESIILGKYREELAKQRQEQTSRQASPSEKPAEAPSAGESA